MLTSPTDVDVILRLGTAVVCGGVIGLERDWRNMPTGFRTLAIVCLGSCVAVLAAIKAGDSDGFSRVAQGIVTGIGFLGGGVIVQTGRAKDVKGLTTAAAIWLTAALGLLCGLGELVLALGVAALAVIVLLFDNALKSLRNEQPPEKAATPAKSPDQPGKTNG
jgi:putative Mg2+ transporter-C (MgtC) family protein